MKSVLFISIFALFVMEIAGNGMVIDPPNRSSRWRFDDTAPVNYDDNSLNCGGFDVQFKNNEGRCGVCGDNYASPHPQPNENTGTYGEGVVVAQYTSGSVIPVTVLLTSNELGTFNYSLCRLDNPALPETEACFEALQLEDGSYSYDIPDVSVMNIQNRVRLPQTACSRCVLRWTYKTEENWGTCDDGTTALGCGPQEHFRTCSDISIV